MIERDKFLITATLTRLAEKGENGVPVLGARCALAHSEQVWHYRRRATDGLRTLWQIVFDYAVKAETYETVVSALTKYQLDSERAAGLR